MTNITYIPGEIANAAIDKHGNRKPVTRTHHIFDNNKNKNQAEVNIDIDNSLNQLSNEIDAVNKQDVISVDALPDVSTADPKKIYRVVGNDNYTDYMVNANGDDWKKLATYSFPGIDDEPTAGSENLVKSGGVANKISKLGLEVGYNSTKIDGVKSASGQLANAANVFHDLIPVNLSAGTKVKLRLSLNKTASYGISFRGIKTSGDVYKFDGDNLQNVNKDYYFVVTEDLTYVGFYGGAREDESNFTMTLTCGIGFLVEDISKNASAIKDIQNKNEEQDNDLIKINGKVVNGVLSKSNNYVNIIPIKLSAGTKIILRLDANITAQYLFNFRYVRPDGTNVQFEQKESSGTHLLNKDYTFELTEDITHVGFWANSYTPDTPFVFKITGNIDILEKTIEESTITIIDKTSNIINTGYYKNELTDIGQMFDDTIYNSKNSNHLCLDVYKGEKVDIITRFSTPAYGEYVITNNIGRIIKKGISNGVSVIEEITENGKIYVNVNSNDATMNIFKIVIKSALNTNNVGTKGLYNNLSDKIYHEEDKIIILNSAAANNFTKLFKGDFYKGQVIEISINSDTDTKLNLLTFRYIKKGATASTIIDLTPVLNKKYRIILPEDANYIGFWSNPASTYVNNAHCILRYGLKADTDHTVDIVNGLYKNSKHIRFAMFTDSHFANVTGDKDEIRDGVNELQRMQLLIDGINKVNKTNPIDFVISCGDTIINNESALQPFVDKVSSKFPAPFISVHGNHDTCSDEVWNQYLRHPKEFSFEFGGFYFILLDTWKGEWNENAGSLTYTEPNLVFLKAELDKANTLGCTPIVALHNVADRTEFKAFLQKNGCNILLVGHQHFFENVIDVNTNKTNAINIMCAGWFAKRTNNYMVSPIVFNTPWGFDVIELKDSDIIRTHYIVPNNYTDSVPTKQEGNSFVPTGEPPLGIVQESSEVYHVWDECVKDSASPTFNFKALIK